MAAQRGAPRDHVDAACQSPPGARRLAALRQQIPPRAVREAGPHRPPLPGVIEATIEWKLTNGISESNNASIGPITGQRSRLPRSSELHHHDHAGQSWHRSVTTLAELTHESVSCPHFPRRRAAPRRAAWSPAGNTSHANRTMPLTGLLSSCPDVARTRTSGSANCSLHRRRQGRRCQSHPRQHR